MGSPSYLLKKQDIYYFRQAWPSSVKSQIGKREIVRSLGVNEKSLAIRMAREFKINLDHIIDHLTLNQLPDTRIVTDFLNESLYKIKVKYRLHQKERSDLTQELETLPALPSVVRPRENNQDRVVYSPASREIKTNIIPLFAKYSAEKTRLKQWSPKSLKERTGHFKLIVSLLKEIKKKKDIFIEDIQVEDVRKIKVLLLVLPKNHNKKFPRISLTELIRRCECVENGQLNGMSTEEIDNIQDKISLNTIADKYVSTIKGFWKWLNDQSYIDTNTFHVLRFDFKKTTNSWKTFTTDDLNNLFNDKIYHNKDTDFSYQYFVPLIALYSSFRLQEVCQLRVKDIICIDGIHAINIIKDNGTSLKTINSERIIPIQNDLISCGLLGYVEYLKINNEKYLFPDLKNDDDSTESRRVSKWFNERYKIKKGIGAGKSFHSFRRTVINEMSRNGASDSEIREIIGHKPDKADTLNNHYKDSLSIQEKNRLINGCILYESCNFPWRKK